MALTPIKDTSRVIKDPVRILVERALLKEVEEANLNVQDREPYARALKIYNNFKENHLTIEPIRVWEDGRRLVCAIDREFGLVKTEIQVGSLDPVEFIKEFLPKPIEFKSARELLLESPSDHKLPAIVHLVTEDVYLYWGPDYLDAQLPENQTAITDMLGGVFVNGLTISAERAPSPVLEKSGTFTISDVSITGGKIVLEAHTDHPEPVDFGIGEWLTEGTVFEESNDISEDTFSFKLTPFEGIPSDAKVTVYLGDQVLNVPLPMTGTFSENGVFTGKAMVRLGGEDTAVLEQAPVSALVEVPNKPGLVYQFKAFQFKVEKDVRRFVSLPTPIEYDGKGITAVVSAIDSYTINPRSPIFTGSDLLTPNGILAFDFDAGSWPEGNLVTADLTGVGNGDVTVKFENGREFNWSSSLSKTSIPVKWVLQAETFVGGLYKATYRMFYPSPLTSGHPVSIDAADGSDNWNVAALINERKVKLTPTGNDTVSIEYYPVISQVGQADYECKLKCFFDAQPVKIDHRKVFSFEKSGLIVTRESSNYDVDTGIATFVDRVFYPNGDIYIKPVEFNPLAMYTSPETNDTLHLVQEYNKLTITINVGRVNNATYEMESQLIATTEPRSAEWKAGISTPAIPTFNIESETAEYVQQTNGQNDPHLLYTFKLTADSVMTTPQLKFPYEIGMNTQAIGPTLVGYDPETKTGAFRIPVKDRTLAPIVYQMRSKLVDQATGAARPANAKVSLEANLIFGLVLDGYTYNGKELVATFTLQSNNDPTKFKSISRADFNNFVDDDFSYVLSEDKTKIITTQKFINQEPPKGDWDTSLILQGVGIGGPWEGEFNLRCGVSYRAVVVDPDNTGQLPDGNGIEIGITNPDKNEVEVDIGGITGLPPGSTVTVSPDKDKIIITWPPTDGDITIGGDITITVKDPNTGGNSSIDQGLDIEVLPPFPGPAKFTLVSFTLENSLISVVQRVTLGEKNVFPNAMVVETPFKVADYAVNPAAPDHVSYSKTDGLLTFQYIVSTPSSGTRNYRFSAQCDFPKYLNPVKATFDQAREFGTPLTPLIMTQKSFSVAFGVAEVSFEVKQQDGAFPEQLTVVSPFKEATNSKNGLVPKTTSYDPATGIAKFSFDVNMPTTTDVTYAFSSEVVLPLLSNYRQSFSFSKLIASPGGFSYAPQILRIRHGKMRANVTLSNLNPALKATSVVINGFSKVLGKNGVSLVPEDVVWNPDNQMLSFSFPVTTAPNNLQTYQFQGETDVDGRTVAIDISWVGTKMYLESKTTELNGDVMKVRSDVLTYSGEVVYDPKTVELISGINLMDDTFHGYYDTYKAFGEIKVVLPTLNTIRYTIVYGITVLKDGVEQTLEQTSLKDSIWNTPASRPVITEKSFTVESGVATVKLGVTIDGVPAMNPRLKVPLTTAAFTVGGTKTPATEVYDIKTGDLTFTFPVIEDGSADRTFAFAGEVMFPFYQSYANAPFSVSKTVLAKKTMSVEQLSSTLSPDRRELSVRYKLTPSAGGYPLDATIQVPFDSVVPAPVDILPVRGYDKATGIGQFTYYFNNIPTVGGDVVFDTKFTATDFVTKAAKFTVTVEPDPRFTIQDQKSAIRGAVLHTEMTVKNGAGGYPNTVTMGNLTAATGTVGGTKTPKATGYDPLTGKFWFDMDIVTSATDGSVQYNFDGTLTVNGNETLAMTVRIPSVKIDIQYVTNGWDVVGSIWRLILTIKRADGSYVKTGNFRVVSIPKLDPGKTVTWTQDTSKTQWLVYIPVTAPATDAKTVYDADLYFEFTTPEGVLTQTPIKAQFISFLPTQGGNRVNTWLDNMTVTGTELTAVVQCEFASSSGKKPIKGIINTPFDMAINTAGGTKNIKRQAYDDASGKATFVFDVVPPAVGGTYYSFSTRIRFPEYGDNITKPELDAAINVNKTIAPPEQTATNLESLLQGSDFQQKLRIAVDGVNAKNASITAFTATKGFSTTTLAGITQSYDQSTGQLLWKAKVVAPSGNFASELEGSITVVADGISKVIPIKFKMNSFDLRIISTGMVAGELQRNYYVTMNGGFNSTATGQYVVNAFAPADTNKQVGTIHAQNEVSWILALNNATPSAGAATPYSGNGYLRLQETDGLFVHLPWTLDFTNYLDTTGGITNTLKDITNSGDDIIVTVQNNLKAGGFPVLAQLDPTLTTANAPTGTFGKTVKSQTYDPATGVLRFVFAGKAPAGGETYTFAGTIKYPDYGANLTVPMNVSKTFPNPGGPFVVTHVESVLKDDVLTVTHSLTNAGNAHPTTATLPALTSATNTVGSSLAIKSESYDPATGLHTFSVDVVPVGTRTSRVYRLGGSINANSGQMLTFDYSVTGHSYTLTQAQVAWVADNLQVKHALIRTSDDTAVNGAKLVITTMPKLLAGATPFAQHYNNDVNYTVPYPVQLPTAAATKYTGSGYLIVPQVDGKLKHYVPWTIDYTSDVIPAPGADKAELQDIDYTANSVTFTMLCRKADGSKPAAAKFITPLYRTLTPARVNGSDPTSTSYDPVTGLLKATFTGKAPTAVISDYQIQGEVVFGTATPEVKIAINGVWPLDNTAPASGIRP